MTDNERELLLEVARTVARIGRGSRLITTVEETCIVGMAAVVKQAATPSSNVANITAGPPPMEHRLYDSVDAAYDDKPVPFEQDIIERIDALVRPGKPIKVTASHVQELGSALGQCKSEIRALRDTIRLGVKSTDRENLYAGDFLEAARIALRKNVGEDLLS